MEIRLHAARHFGWFHLGDKEVVLTPKTSPFARNFPTIDTAPYLSFVRFRSLRTCPRQSAGHRPPGILKHDYLSNCCPKSWYPTSSNNHSCRTKRSLCSSQPFLSFPAYLVPLAIPLYHPDIFSPAHIVSPHPSPAFSGLVPSAWMLTALWLLYISPFSSPLFS